MKLRRLSNGADVVWMGKTKHRTEFYRSNTLKTSPWRAKKTHKILLRILLRQVVKVIIG